LSDPTRYHETAVVEALETCAPAVKQVGPGRWGFELVNGKAFPVSARALEGWLLLETGTDSEDLKDGHWQLLERNGRLGGWSKFALGPGRRHPHLRAEIPLTDGVVLRQRLQEACEGLREGQHADAAPAAESVALDVSDEKQSPSWPALLAEAGWTFSERTAGRLLVDLDVPGRWHRARVDAGGERDVRLAVEIGGGKAVAPLARQALGVLLLSANRAVRLARSAVEAGGATEAVFEVPFGTPPSAAELDLALSALSVACRLFDREARALEDENVARRYLELQGWLS